MSVYHIYGGIQDNEQNSFWTTSKEIEYAWRKTFREKCSKQWFVCARKTQKKVYRFLLHWTKTVQHGTKKSKRCKDNRWLQKQAKRMDMGKHPLVLWLVIKIDKETFIDLYLFILLLFESFIILLDKQIHLHFRIYKNESCILETSMYESLCQIV